MTVLGALILATVVSSADTIVEARPGDRLSLNNVSGEVLIQAWDRDQVEVRSDGGPGSISLRRDGAALRVGGGDRKGRRRSVEALIRVPAWIDVEIGGRSLDVALSGIEGSIEVRNVSGDVWIEDVRGPVEVRTVEGEIDVSRAYAGVRASSQSDEVRLREVAGPVVAHSGSGDLVLDNIDSERVRAETQDGDIAFSGTISDRGEYRFFVHSGDAFVAIPSDADARISVSTFDGEFQSEFPVRLERFTGGREFEFTMGRGGARIEIQVFDGEIRLLERQ